MLRKFEVENFKGFRDKITLDLTTTKNYEFNKHLIKDNVINKAVIYGVNGSGKSNLGLAIFDITFLLAEEINSSALPFEQYYVYLNAESIKDVATFTYEFQFADDIVIYTYQKNDLFELVYEKLLVNDKLMIEYNFLNHKYINNIYEAEKLDFAIKDNKTSILKYIANNCILRSNNPLRALFRYVDGMIWFNSYQDDKKFETNYAAETVSNYIYNKNIIINLERFLHHLGFNYKLTFIDSNNKKLLAFDKKTEKVNFFSIASSGAKKLLWLFVCLEQSSEYNFLFIDDFDVHFHHEVAIKLLDLINYYNNFQSIITTHNTALISNTYMRPDCYFVINGSQIKNLPQLTSKELREAHNIEKMYRTGEFDISE